ncbi:hypothetical protein CDL12_05619 [Handroanthus impetiginosus]|uniref:DUF4408 domain-containing protein n=1 Tax=Handroanthus impetiginosus TaxID=429701 RepID=A0A2G9HW48_9LAMI|nr:hypothetical protein CDL12_05619 [Handroanthus impetiginosus]
MEGQMFDNMKFEKEKAIARFNRLRRVVKLWQIFEVLVVFGLISWSSTRVPAVLKVTGGYFVEFSTYFFNHHVVFLIGNAIIVFLFMLCRQNDVNLSGGGDFYDDYVKYSEAAHQRESSTLSPLANTEVPPVAESSGADEEKQIVAHSQCDDVTAAIEKATRQIKRFQRTQSEKLKQEIAVRPQPELRRSETGNCRKTASSSWSSDAAEIENLSNEEFRQRVDAFIDKHWIKRKTKDYGNYQLLKMA